jgi:hypothetical protein
MEEWFEARNQSEGDGAMTGLWPGGARCGVETYGVQCNLDPPSRIAFTDEVGGRVERRACVARRACAAPPFRATEGRVLSRLLDDSAVTPRALAAHLDGLSPAARLTETLGLDGPRQARLFELAQGARRFTLDDLAPAGGRALVGVRHEGRNSLPAFSRFAKVFAVPDEASTAASERWGFNATSRLVTVTVGPGYFVAVQQGDEVLVDYTRLPPRPLEGGPRILGNASRLSYFVYNGTRDVVRGVSAHVSIGRAWRGEQRLDNWFVLCRV